MFIFSFSAARRSWLLLLLPVLACACSAPVTHPDANPPMEAAAATVRLPASARLGYKLTGGARGMAFHADSELSWTNAGDRYDAVTKVTMMFLIASRSAASTGTIGAKGLSPLRFTDKGRSELSTFFEAEAGKIRFSANTPTLPWVQGAQDRVSVFIQLGGMLAGHTAGFPVGSTFPPIYTAGPRDAETWTFQVETEEKLTLPFGELATVKLTRLPPREHDPKVEVWYAPSLGYLPVRNKITQGNGEFVDQQLSALRKD